MRKLKWGCMLIICLVLPVIVNLISNYELPYSNQIVAGKEGDWIGFFGSYIGSLIGAGVTLFMLYREAEINALDLQIEKQEHRIDELKKDISAKLALFDFVYLGSEISLVPAKEIPKIADYVILRMNEKHISVTQQYNSWMLCQGDMSDYNQAYGRCVKQYMDDINEVTRKIKSYVQDEITTVEFLSWVKEFNYKMIKHKDDFLQPLADEGIKLLALKRMKLSKLQQRRCVSSSESFGRTPH